MRKWQLTASANPPARLTLLDEFGVSRPLPLLPRLSLPLTVTELRLTPLSRGAAGGGGLPRPVAAGRLAGGAGGVGFARPPLEVPLFRPSRADAPDTGRGGAAGGAGAAGGGGGARMTSSLR